MMAADREESVGCDAFRGMLYRFEADELDGAERQACQRHLDRCTACAERLEVETGMWEVLRAKLPRTPAPPGLATRVRAALRGELGPRAARMPWFRSPSFAAAAAAVLLTAVLLPGFREGARAPAAAEGIHVTRQVTVVDHDCDRAGRDLAAQRRCTDPLHVNALKLATGEYWTISPASTEFRYLLLDASSRGRRLEVEGAYYTGPGTIVLRRVVSLDRDRL